MKVLARTTKLLLPVALLVLATGSIAQTKPGPPFKPNPSLSDQEKRGQYLFFQRCSVCHVPQYTKTSSVSDLPPVFVSLNSLFKNADSGTEKTARAFILKGTQRMPGFQYGLKPEEVDDLIAYLKTFARE